MKWRRNRTEQYSIQPSAEDLEALERLGDEEAIAMFGTILREQGVAPLAVEATLYWFRADPTLMRKAFAVAAQ